MRLPDVQITDDGNTQSFAPCKDAAVTIRNDTLFVNGEGYGQLAAGDRVLVKHGIAHIEPR